MDDPTGDGVEAADSDGTDSQGTDSQGTDSQGTDREGTDVGDDRGYRSEPYVDTGEVPSVEEIMAQAARSAGVGVATTSRQGRGRDRTEADGAGGGGHDDVYAPLAADADDGADDGPRPRFWRRRPKTTIAIIVVLVLIAYPAGAYVQALRKEGSESVSARTAQWARDMHLGFAVDWAERRMYATDQFAQGGDPDATAFEPAATLAPASVATTTKVTIPHTEPPTRMASPISPPAPGEGEWTPIGPQPKGLPGVYITKVRPDTTHTSLTLFAAWIDPQLTSIKLFPGTDLPGGKWSLPNKIPAEQCSSAIMASNGGFRMDQANGGYYAEGREPFKLRDGAASLVFYQNGTVDVAKWGRDVGRDQLPAIDTVRQNLVLLVDEGQPVSNIASLDWGAELPNSYFVWRSGYGVTKDGALVYVGGPALTPEDLARALINAGAVRAMEGDINPEWVTAIIYADTPEGCTGQRGLGGPENTGGMRAPENRYLQTETRDFVAVFAKP